jgi:hypothetical protein
MLAQRQTKRPSWNARRSPNKNGARSARTAESWITRENGTDCGSLKHSMDENGTLANRKNSLAGAGDEANIGGGCMAVFPGIVGASKNLRVTASSTTTPNHTTLDTGTAVMVVVDEAEGAADVVVTAVTSPT